MIVGSKGRCPAVRRCLIDRLFLTVGASSVKHCNKLPPNWALLTLEPQAVRFSRIPATSLEISHELNADGHHHHRRLGSVSLWHEGHERGFAKGGGRQTAPHPGRHDRQPILRGGYGRLDYHGGAVLLSHHGHAGQFCPRRTHHLDPGDRRGHGCQHRHHGHRLAGGPLGLPCANHGHGLACHHHGLLRAFPGLSQVEPMG